MEQRIVAQFTDECGCSATGTDDKSRLTFHRCALHRAAPGLLAALEKIRQHAAPLIQQKDPLGFSIDRIARAAIEAAKS